MYHPQAIADVIGLHQKGITGNQVKVGVLDYQVDFDNIGLAHQNPLNTVVLASGARSLGNQPSRSYHGTAMAGIIAARHNEVIGVAPDSVLTSLALLDTPNTRHVDDGLFEYMMSKVIEMGIQVLNISLNFADDYRGIKSRALQKVIQHGCVVCCSSGNDRLLPNQGLDFPANLKLPGLIVVGAATLERSLFLNAPFHDNITIYAPGHRVLTLTTGQSEVWYMGLNDSSSAATAFVSGAVALIRQVAPTLAPAAIAKLLCETGQPLKKSESMPIPVVDKPFLNIPAAVQNASYLKQRSEAQKKGSGYLSSSAK